MQMPGYIYNMVSIMKNTEEKLVARKIFSVRSLVNKTISRELGLRIYNKRIASPSILECEFVALNYDSLLQLACSRKDAIPTLADGPK